MSNSANQHRYMAWLVWGLAAAFFFSEYFARVSPGVMTEGLMHDFGVTAFALGALASFFYYAYVGMQLPVGMLMDRYGCRRLLTSTALLCGLSCFLFATAKSLYVAELARFVMGFSAAFAFVGALKLASEWFPAAKFGLLAGLTQGLGMLGASVGEGPVAVLVDHAGWRYTMLIIGTVLLMIGILMWLIIKDHPTGGVNSAHPPAAKKHDSLLRSLMIVMKNPQTWFNGIAVGFLYAPTETFAELWGPSYLHHVNHINMEVASAAVGMIFIGWFISSPIIGWLSDRIKRRRPVVIFSALSSMLVMSAVLYLPHLPTYLLFILLFLYGACNIGVSICYVIARESHADQVSATAMAFANMASVLIGAFFQPLVGWVLDLNWDHQLINGVPQYSIHAYHIALLLLPLCFVISLIASLLIKESYGNTFPAVNVTKEKGAKSARLEKYSVTEHS